MTRCAPTSRPSSRGDHGDPFAVLGPHPTAPRGQLSLRVFAPEAEEVDAISSEDGNVLSSLARVHPSGFFIGLIPETHGLCTGLRFKRGEHVWEASDPYRFPPYLGEIDIHLMAEGSHRRLYDKLGAHPVDLRRRLRALPSPSGRRTRAASASSAISTAGTAVAIRCGCASRPEYGSCSFPVLSAARSISSRLSAPMALGFRSSRILSRSPRRCRRKQHRARSACRVAIGMTGYG